MELIEQNPDTALILLDVVMESDRAGLDTVHYIRNELKNDLVNIILRTGQPGEAPEEKVILRYEINDYKAKQELTAQKLFTVVTASLRSYQFASNLKKKNQELQVELERRRIAEMKAKAANEAKSEFLANMSHELRTPMHAILGFAEIGAKKLGTKQLSTEKAVGFFNKIKISGERLMSLLSNLLDFSKLESGKMQYLMKKNDLINIVEEVVDEYADQLEEKAIQCQIIQPDFSVLCSFDTIRIEQVIKNLMSNAVKFTDRNGDITISFEKEAQPTDQTGSISVTIKDNGIGIPENELEFVFDKFTQSSSTKSGAGGTGLGLAICKEIIMAHDGTIRAANNPDGGCAFTFSIPVEKRPKRIGEMLISEGYLTKNQLIKTLRKQNKEF